VDEVWDRIMAWLRINAPEVLDNLRSGAMQDDIRATEAALGVVFPNDVTASYLLHDGQGYYSPPLMGSWQLLSLASIVNQWEIMRDIPLDEEPHDADDPNNPVRPDWWNPRWVPVAYDGGGDLCCVDLDPAPNGIAGQMTIFWHTDEERERLALSFRDWLSSYADDLEQGKYVVHRENEITTIERIDD